MREIIVVVVMVGGAALTSTSCAPVEGARVPPVEDHRAGQRLAFAVEDLRNDGHIHLSDLRGKVVLVDFWASWCEPCRRSFPFYDRLYARYARQGLSVLGVSLDDERALARRFFEDTPVSFPLGWDARHEVAESLGISTMPTAYLLDAEGVVHHVHEGYLDGDQPAIEQRVRELLGLAGAPGRASAP